MVYIAGAGSVSLLVPSAESGSAFVTVNVGLTQSVNSI